MIRKLEVEGVTVFAQREVFHFERGINIIVGGNDSGKSHLMKLCYAIARWACTGSLRDLPERWAEEKRLRSNLLRTFSTQDLTGLTANNRGCPKACIKASLEGEKVPIGSADLAFHFTAHDEAAGLHISRVPDRYLHDNALFITPREVLSIYPCYMQVGKRYPELLDGPSWELCCALENNESYAPNQKLFRPVAQQIQKLLAGKLLRQHGRFYLQRAKQEPIELSLIAEGFKRIGTLGLLIENGTIRAGSTLFWDEPEMNLNTGYLPNLVRIMMTLVEAGVQLILSTHSLFLLRELVIQLNENPEIARKFFGLEVPQQHVQGVRVSQSSHLEELPRLESLDAEVEQADRYLSMSYPCTPRPE